MNKQSNDLQLSLVTKCPKVPNVTFQPMFKKKKEYQSGKYITILSPLQEF